MEKGIKNILKNFSGGSIITIFYILTGIITARVLGPKGKGELISAIYWPQMFGWIFNLGLSYANTYFVAKDTRNINFIISNSIVFAVVISFFPIIIGYFSVPYLIKDTSIHNIVRWSLLVVPFAILGDYIIWTINGLQKYIFFNIARALHPILYLIALIIFIRDLSVTKAVIFSISATFFAFFIVFIVLMKMTKFHFSFNFSLLIKSLKLGIKSHIGLFASLGNKRADQGILIALVSPAFIAFYGMAVNIAELLLQISFAVALTIIPSTASLNKGDSKNLIIKMLKLSAIWLLIGGIVIFFIAKYLILFLYGKAFLPALLPAKILVPGTIFLGLSTILENGLKGKAKPLLSSTSQFVSFALNIILLAVLIPSMKIMGAAVASDIAYFTLFALDAIFLIRILKIKTD